MRGHFVIGIGYDTDIAAAQNIGLDVLKKHEAILNDPMPQILVDSLGSSTINCRVYFWIDSRHHALYKVASEAMRLIVGTFLENNISMPDDAREVIFPEGIDIIERSKTGLPLGITHTPDSACIPANIANNLNPEENLESDFKTVSRQAAESRQPDEGHSII